MTRKYTARVSLFGSTTITLQALENQLDVISITSGSSNGLDQPQPGTCTIQLLNPQFGAITMAPADMIGLGIAVYIEVWNDTSVQYVAFWGTISSVQMEALDAEATNNIVTITANDYLADLAGLTLGATAYPEQTEDARLIALSNELGQTWNDLGGILWSDFPLTFTWNEFSTFNLNSLITGTRYLLADAGGNPTSALQFLQSMADTNGLWLRPNGQGAVIESMSKYVTAQTIDAAQSLIFTSLTSNVSIADRYNNIAITNGTVTGYATDPADTLENGDYPLEIQSTLRDLLDLQALANQKLTSHALGVQTIDRITVDLDQITDNFIATQLTGYDRTNLTLNNMPSLYMPTGTNGNKWQVRGGTATFSNTHAEADLVIVPYAVYNQGTVAWSSIDSSLTWNTWLTPTTTWNNIN